MCFYHPWPFFQIHGTARAFKRNIRHGLDMNQKQSIEIPTQKLRKKNVFCLQAATDLEDTGNKNHNDKTFSLRKRKCNQVQQKLRDKEKTKSNTHAFLSRSRTIHSSLSYAKDSKCTTCETSQLVSLSLHVPTSWRCHLLCEVSFSIFFDIHHSNFYKVVTPIDRHHLPQFSLEKRLSSTRAKC